MGGRVTIITPPQGNSQDRRCNRWPCFPKGRGGDLHRPRPCRQRPDWPRAGRPLDSLEAALRRPVRRTWGNVTGWPETLARWFWAWAGDPGDPPRGTGSSASGAMTLIPDAERVVKKTQVCKQEVGGRNWKQQCSWGMLGVSSLPLGGATRHALGCPASLLPAFLGSIVPGFGLSKREPTPGRKRTGTYTHGFNSLAVHNF